MRKKRFLLHAICQWILLGSLSLTTLPAAAADADGYIPNATGGLRIGVAQGNSTLVLLDEPTLLKTTFDQGWLHARDEWSQQVVALLNDLGDQESVVVTSKLTTIDNTELQVRQTGNGVSLKYVLHDNQMRVALKDVWLVGDLSYRINFELALVMTVQASNQTPRLQVVDAAIKLPHLQIDGEGIKSDALQFLVEALLAPMHEQIANRGNMLLNALHEAGNEFVAALLASIPTDAIYLDFDVTPTNGVLALCFKAERIDRCRFTAS